MVLYVCPECGLWQDVTLAQSISNVLRIVAQSLNQQPPEQLGYPCPAGHGLMISVEVTDRVFVKQASIEAIPDMPGLPEDRE